MKKSYFFVLALFLNSIIISASISVMTPDGGDHWNIGETVYIEWISRGDMDRYVKIRLFDKTGSNKLLAITDKTPNNGKFEWTIPQSLHEGEYIIRVKTFDNNFFGNSPVFPIKDRRLIKINLISPSGGARYLTPGTMLIKWEMESAHLVEHIKLTLKKGGQVKHHIVLDNDGSESLPLTDNINDGTDYSIRIEDAVDPTIFDESGYFEVYHSSPASIRMEITHPVYLFLVGETVKIKWTCLGFDGIVDVDLLKDGSLVKTLAPSIRDNFFNWKIDEPQGTNYMIRVSAVNKPGLSDSGGTFVIFSSADFQVFSRKGIFEKGTFMKNESTTLRFRVNNPTSERVPVTFSIRFYKGKIKRPSGITIRRKYILAQTGYRGSTSAYLVAGTNTNVELPVTINDRPGDYTVIITALPSTSSNVKDNNKGNNTIYGYFKVVFKTLKLKIIK